MNMFVEWCPPRAEVAWVFVSWMLLFLFYFQTWCKEGNTPVAGETCLEAGWVEDIKS
jgi:hypothetical protein